MTWTQHFAYIFGKKRSTVSENVPDKFICTEIALKLYHWAVSALIQMNVYSGKDSLGASVHGLWCESRFRTDTMTACSKLWLFGTCQMPLNKGTCMIIKIFKHNLSNVVSGILNSQIYTIFHIIYIHILNTCAESFFNRFFTQK